jgi:glycosyltransferase involved in cell wall biosynthesis
MLGTHPEAMGGIAAVVSVYREAGLFDRWPVVYLVTHCNGTKPVKAAVAFKAWLRFVVMLLAGRVAAVHVHMAMRASFWRKSLFMLPALLCRIPSIVHLHGSEFAIFYERECGRVRRAVIRYIFDSVRAIVVLSGSWKSWVSGTFRNPNVVTIHNSVFIPHTTPWDERQSGKVLFLGRLGRRKGVYDLLEAAARIAADVPTMRLCLAGDGELEQVRARAEALGIVDRVQLLGWVRGGKKARLLASASVYALPSYAEGMPMSVLEAMAAGLPVLSTPAGGIPDAVRDGVEGLLVNPGDVAALADRLHRLLLEPGLAERMGSAARRRAVGCFSAGVVIAQVESLYVSLGIRRDGHSPG